jgi:hypothetical protein
MKRIFVLALVALFSITAKSQITTPTPGYITGQMVNLSNPIPYAALDTTTNATTIYLSTAKWSSTTGLPYVNPVYGAGTISFTVAGRVISGTAHGYAKLQQSVDGVNWGDVYNGTTLIIDSNNVVTATPVTHDFVAKYSPYYRVKVYTWGTSVMTFIALFGFTPTPNLKTP